MNNIILEHTIKAIFSGKAEFPSDPINDSTYIPDYMTDNLLKYLDLIVKKEYDSGMVENEGVHWDLWPTARVNIGLTGNVDGEIGNFVLTFDFPSGRPRKPSFEGEY